MNWNKICFQHFESRSFYNVLLIPSLTYIPLYYNYVYIIIIMTLYTMTSYDIYELNKTPSQHFESRNFYTMFSWSLL